MMKAILKRHITAFSKLKGLAPYAAIELVLPGGSVMALLLWLYRRRKSAGGWTNAWRSLNAPVCSVRRLIGLPAAENIP